MFYRGRLVVGLAASALGIILARANELLLGTDSPYLTATYLLGVFVGLAGLAVVASSLVRSYETRLPCPHCLTLNRVDAKSCVRCRRTLPNPRVGSIASKEQ